MPIQIANNNLWVHDQDEALSFWTENVGLELRDDITLPEFGDYRWLTVGVPKQPDVSIVLNVPGPPVMEPDEAKVLLDLIAKGHIGGIMFSTDDCKQTYEELKARGVPFQMEPTEVPYGIDAEFRDPSGNRFRLTQRSI